MTRSSKKKEETKHIDSKCRDVVTNSPSTSRQQTLENKTIGKKRRWQARQWFPSGSHAVNIFRVTIHWPNVSRIACVRCTLSHKCTFLQNQVMLPWKKEKRKGKENLVNRSLIFYFPSSFFFLRTSPIFVLQSVSSAGRYCILSCEGGSFE